MIALHLGDIVGSPGRRAFTQAVQRLKEEHPIDFIVVNGENAAAGRGITPALADSLFEAGADVITLGDHAWDQKEIYDYIAGEPRLIRPANFPSACPGQGHITVETPCGPITVMICIGRVFMHCIADCPFREADRILADSMTAKMVMAEIHCEATSEKIAFGRYLEGRVSSVVGTHTHVQTSDDTVLPKGTAFLTDLGMTGPKDSVLGREVAAVLTKMTTGMPTRFGIASKDVVTEGVLLEIDERTGKALRIERLRIPFSG